MTQKIVNKGFKIAIIKYVPYVQEHKETHEHDKNRCKRYKIRPQLNF